jgi:hypothetical protein
MTIPITLKEDIEEIAQGKESTINKLYYLVYVIQNRLDRKYRDLISYKPISKNYFEKMFGSKYYKLVKLLGGEGVIQSTDFYAKGTPYGYRINPNYFVDAEYVKIKFHYRRKTIGSEVYESEKEELCKYINNFQKLKIPFGKLYAAIDDTIKRISLLDYDTDDRVEWTYIKEQVFIIEDDWNYRELGYLTKEEALLYADLYDKVLIDTGDKKVIADPKYFLWQTKEFTRESWTQSVDSLASQDTLYAQRNDTNNRLDSNFTNMPKELYEIILRENGMVEIDLKNSQPTLLAHLLKKEGVQGDGVEEYIRLCEHGKFYESFELERNAVKKMVFKVLFGKNPKKTDNESLVLKEFVRRFPKVYDYVREYKSRHGKNSVAIKLQKLESNLFIDRIYYDLLNQKKLVFSKHDSIACKIGDWDPVNSCIMDNFDKINFKGETSVNLFTRNAM